MKKSFQGTQLLLLTSYLLYILFMIKNGTRFSFIASSFPIFIISISKLLKSKSLVRLFIPTCFLILVFSILLNFITYNNISNNNEGFYVIIILVMNIFTFYYLINVTNIITIKNSFLFITVFVVFIPHFLLIKKLDFGAFYNIIDTRLLTTTTVEGPLITSILFILSIFDLLFNKRWTLINVFSIVFSFLLLLVFNRKGFIISSILAILFYYICNFSKKKFIAYLSLPMLFLPMFWEFISIFIVNIFKYDFVKYFLVRNDTSEIAEATGRVEVWNNILNLFFSFQSRYFFGIKGGPNENLFLDSGLEYGRYSHAHNSFLQIFLNGGYFMNLLLLLVIIHSLNNFNRARMIIKNTNNFYFILLVFFLSLSATESLIRSTSLTTFIFCFIIIGFNSINSKINQQMKTK